MGFPGHVSELVTVHDQAAAVGGAEVANRVSGFRRKRYRLNRKNTCTPRRLSCAHSSTSVEEVAFFRAFVYLGC